ncbi:efflux RND transporter periplasmic adaptor subunit, partial [Rhizobiaceae sp. 2RAB30]
MSAKNRLVLPFAGLLLAGVSVISALPPALAAQELAPAVQAPPAIRVAVARKRELIEKLSVTGTVIAREEAAAGTDLGGLTVLKLNADEGDKVRKGDVLAVLDRSLLDTQLAQMDASKVQAEASVAQARAQIDDAEIGVRQAGEALERARALQKKGVTAQAQLDDAVNAYDSANAKRVSAEKALAAAEAQIGVIDAQKKNVLVQIDKTEVRAPADGLVLSRSATLGGIVSAAGGPLFRIAIGGEFELSANVAETVLPRLAVDMPVEVALAGSKDAVEGRVRRIAPEINQASRLGSIRIALAPGCGARGGNFARAEIEILRRQGVAVPASALIYQGSDAFLQLVDNGKVKTVPVTVGARTGTFAEI